MSLLRNHSFHHLLLTVLVVLHVTPILLSNFAVCRCFLSQKVDRWFLPQKSHLLSLSRRSSFYRTFFGGGSTALVQLFYPSVGILKSEFHSDCRLSLPKPVHVHEWDFFICSKNVSCKHFSLKSTSCSSLHSIGLE